MVLDRSAIPECRLSDAGFGAQLRRYRELSRHVEHIERAPGKLLVRFDNDMPPGLLERTLQVERECCPFVQLDSGPDGRELAITVQNIAQDPRLDSLFQALAQPGRQPPPSAGPNIPTGRGDRPFW